MFDSVDWQALLQPETPLLETLLRGTITYLALFLLLRLLLKRQAGVIGITDLLLVVLIADAAQNAMADDYTSITDGILLVATIVFWDLALDWLAYRSQFIGRLVRPPPLELIRDGRELRRNMARELITHEELISHLRAQGIEDAAQVKHAYIEVNGQISVIKADEQPHQPERRPIF